MVGRLNHFVNWALLGLADSSCSPPVPRFEAFVIVVGVGAIAAILWELAEYFAFIRDSAELETAYTDTLGDMRSAYRGHARRARDRDRALEAIAYRLIGAPWFARQDPGDADDHPCVRGTDSHMGTWTRARCGIGAGGNGVTVR